MFRTLLISMFLTSTALADTWTVDDDGKADFDNIQAAVGAASDGDEIIVMPGTYVGTGDYVLTVGKSIHIRSSDGASKTIIDGEGVRQCVEGQSASFVLEGFTITGGYAYDSQFGGEAGGAIDCYSVTLEIIDCVISENQTRAPTANITSGGAVQARYSSLSISGCIFEDNAITHSSDSGGAIWWYKGGDTFIEDTIFRNNSTQHGNGGAISLQTNNSGDPGDVTITNCQFESNEANGSNGSGGGIVIYYQMIDLYLGDCYFCDNSPNDIAGPWQDLSGNIFGSSCSDTDGDGAPNDIDNCYLFNPDQADCNGNGVGDVCDIEDGISSDLDGSGIPDECECLSDIALDDGQVNVHDLLILIAMWGTDSPTADINYDGIVNVHDLLIVIGNWGPCE